MAGGRFDKLAGKVRPGTYINFETTKHDILGISERGTVIVPLTNHNYGPVGEFVELTTQAPDAKPEVLGYSIYDEDDNRQMLLIREAFKRAAKVIVYKINGGTKATGAISGITATAKYAGTRGNKLNFAITENPTDGYDLEINLDGRTVALLEGIKTVEEMNGQSYIDFGGSYTPPVTATAEQIEQYADVSIITEVNPKEEGYYEKQGETYVLTNDETPVDGKEYFQKLYDDSEAAAVTAATLPVTAGVNLTGATDEAMSNSDVTAFLDAVERVKFNTLCFPIETPALQSAAKTKIKYLRDSVGKGVQVVMPNTSAGDYEGVINVTNSVKLDDNALTAAEACAWVAAAEASASNVQSATYWEYEGATEVVDPKTHEQAVDAIKKGQLFFSISEGGAVIVEYDINTLVTYGDKKDKSYSKNRIIRVFDTFAEAVQLNFPPNKFDNSTTGWAVMEGVGRSILKQFADVGAIDEVDYDNDFVVDRSKSEGDETYFNVGLKAVDSAEKLYFTISTR